MDELEQLERRKRELELRRDIARLERNEKVATKVSQAASSATDLVEDVSDSLRRKRSRVAAWGWIWVSLSALIGGYLVLGGIVDGPIWIAAIGAVFLIPIWVKMTR